MKLLTPYELLYLKDRNCPECNGKVDYDESNTILFCTTCNKQWLYKLYKDSKDYYEEHLQAYTNNLKAH